MNAFGWFAVAAVLAVSGLGLLAAARRGGPDLKTQRPAERRTGGGEGPTPDPPPGGLFAARTDPNPDYRPGHQP